MAQVTFTIPNQNVAAIKQAIVRRSGITQNAGETDLDYFKRFVVAYVVAFVRSDQALAVNEAAQFDNTLIT